MKKERDLFSIGEVARALNITRRAILYYEEFGLIRPDVKDGATGNRYYTIDTFVKLRTIRILQNLGLSLSDVLGYFDGDFALAPLIRRLELELHKPEAPIPLPFGDVSVRIERGWHRAFVAFGSNMGDKEYYLEKGLKELKEHPLCRPVKVSKVYRTTPYGGVEQEDFLNGVMELETLLTPFELLEKLQQVERQAGRERKVHWGPRTLDLDLLLYDDCVIDTETLTVPHPDMQNRDFVLAPLCEIAPFVRHPFTGKTAKQMLEELKHNGEKHVVDTAQNKLD